MRLKEDKPNQDIRNLIRISGFRQSDVAAELGYSTAWFTQTILYMKEPEVKKHIYNAIIDLIVKRDQNDQKLIAEIKKLG